MPESTTHAVHSSLPTQSDPACAVWLPDVLHDEREGSEMSASPSGSALARTTLATLKSRIMSGQWPVGARIPTEPELAEELGVGRSTIREAVRSLATLGMVETLTARGTFVRSAAPSASLLLEAVLPYEPAALVGVRRALDVEAAQAAAARREPSDLVSLEESLAYEIAVERTTDSFEAHPDACAAFHSAIARAANNRLLTELHQNLSTALRDSGIDARIAEATDPSLRANDHNKILDAIRAGDVGSTAHLMAVHVDRMLRTLTHETPVTELTSLSDGVSHSPVTPLRTGGDLNPVPAAAAAGTPSAPAAAAGAATVAAVAPISAG